jgi:hypothetical protein
MTEVPGRSLVSVELLPAENDGDIRALLICDCGTATDLTVRLEGPVAEGAEAAFTCDGCGTSHWFTVGAAPDPAEDPDCE